MLIYAEILNLVGRLRQVVRQWPQQPKFNNNNTTINICLKYIVETPDYS